MALMSVVFFLIDRHAVTCIPRKIHQRVSDGFFWLTDGFMWLRGENRPERVLAVPVRGVMVNRAEALAALPV